MHKWQQHILLTLILIAAIDCILAAPTTGISALLADGADDALLTDGTEVTDVLAPLLQLIKESKDYDVHYDQRQRGKSNIRIKLDGIFVSAPSSAADVLALLVSVPFMRQNSANPTDSPYFAAGAVGEQVVPTLQKPKSAVVP